MCLQKTWAVLVATSLTLTTPSLAQAAQLYRATPLPGVIPNLAWVERSNGFYRSCFLESPDTLGRG
ncbi:hypothetical protein K4A83_06320 [Spirulina subsalsa FACHB-351]|uniref:Uncharacterized protein n=1 Tax=Spirulina subsalsa FACHB-351 TaxID=234711 RepID=A0ABT3L305_9CYAN|nr:hypothetical protein [Spirulina subsalsa]MCW6035886.1 hypothetical protein [Spirulina subsalsa FACHB-351]